MDGLIALGYEVVLASSVLSAHTPWNAASIEGLRQRGVFKTHVYETTTADRNFLALLDQFRVTKFAYPRTGFNLARELLKFSPPIVATLLGARATPPINGIQHSPPDMRRWFATLVHEVEPTVVVMNYAYWDGLIDHLKLRSVLRVIDTLDLVSLNQRMQQAIAGYLPDPLLAATTPDNVLKEDFFEDLRADTGASEFRIFDKYDRTIAISAKEVDLISRHARRTKVSWLPVTLEPHYVSNTYADSALFTVGPNLFNTQGYLYFVKKVLPRVLRGAPSFVLNVTGAFPSRTPETAPGVSLSGFVPDLGPVYSSARFFVCPVFGGTGQQIKIVEAMAHGLPVVALRFAAERSPLQDGTNGLVANNAEEFAEHCVRLWTDTALCRQLGNAARETVAREFSRDRLTESLAKLLEP